MTHHAEDFVRDNLTNREDEVVPPFHHQGIEFGLAGKGLLDEGAEIFSRPEKRFEDNYWPSRPG